MATDFAFELFGLSVLLGIAALACIAILGRKKPSSAPPSFGRSRIALGYLGALAALLVYCAIDACLLGRSKVSLGHVTVAEACQRIPGWALYLFVLTTPLVIFFLTVLGLPTLAVLRRMRLASVASSLAASLCIAALLSSEPVIFPYNLWCGAHRFECFSSAFVSEAMLVLR